MWTQTSYCHSAGGTISALQDLGSREKIFTASPGFPTMGTLTRRLITYFRLAAKWFDSAEFIAVSTLTLTIFLCWRLWSLSLRDRLSLKPSTSSQTCHLFLILTWVGSMRRMFPQNLKPPPWRIRHLKPCEVITKVLSILLQERFLEDVCVPRNHGYPRLLLLLLISAGKLSEGEM